MQTSSSGNPKPNNLDVALQAFIGKFVPSDNARTTVGQIIRGISHNAESLCKAHPKQPQMTLYHPTNAISSMTVVHKLDDFTEKLVKENMELKEENEVLKAQIATLEGKGSAQEASNASSPSVESLTGSNSSSSSTASGGLPKQSSSESSPTSPPSTTSLTTDEINRFNKLPKSLKEFYEQMNMGKFSSDTYSKCNSTKSVFTKRKLVFKYMQEYPGGLEQFLENYKGKSPTWIYNNVVRSKRS